MKSRFTFLFVLIVFSGIVMPQERPGTVFPFNADFSLTASNNFSGATPELLTGDVFLDGANRLTSLQYTDGGWGWPLNAPPTYGNILGPIAAGLAKAYYYTGSTTHRTALSNAGTFLLSKTNNFSPSDGYLAAYLDQIFGGTTYRQHVLNNFYNPLALGTYNRNGLGVLYSTASYVNYIRTSRSGAQANLAAWDIGMGLVAASMCGGGTADWITGVKAEINELDGANYYDVIGLAGALYSLAFVSEEFDPTAGQHAAASSLMDLANILAGYQIALGGFAWNSAYVIPNDGNETIQETGYAILALAEVDRDAFLNNIRGAGNYLKSVQLASGGWENYTASGENNEVSAEALWGLSMAGPVENVTQNTFSLSIQQGISTANASDVLLVTDGNYTENITINKNVKLISANGRDFTTITGISGAGKNATVSITAPTTAVQIGDINQGFKIIGIDNGSPGIENAAVYFVGGPHSNAVIKNNEIVAAGDEGLLCDYNAAVTYFTIDGNIFSGKTFIGDNPAGDGFSAQFTLPNVPRQLVVMGGGSSGTNTHHITFTNNQVTGTAGGISVTGNTGLPIAPIEQGNNLVTIDAEFSTISGNIFSGTTTRYAVSFRCRRPSLSLAGNSFSSAGLTPTTGHLYVQNNALNPALIAPNTFDAGSYIYNGTQVNIVDGFTTAAYAPAGSAVFGINGELYVAGALKIQDAVAAASNGNIINVAPGTYSSNGTTITINKSVTITGADKSNTFIDVSTNGSAWGIRLGADNITLRNFTVIPAYTAGGAHEGYPVHASSNSNPLLELFNITLENITVNGSDRTGLDFHGVTGLTLTNITSTNAQYGNGVQFSGCWNVTMSNITTSGNAWGGIAVYCSNPVYNLNRDKYSNNISFDFASNNINEWLYVEDEFGLVNSNITFTGWSHKINNRYNPGTANYTAYINKTLADAVNFALGLNAKFSNTKSYLTDNTGEFYVGAGMSIQAAVDNTADGNKVNVLAGTFNEAVNVNTIIELSGAGSNTDGTIITNAAGTALTLGAGTSAENAANVTAKNLRLTGSVTGLAVSSFNTIDNVVSVANTTYGISLNNLTNLIITNSKFNQNSAGLKIASQVSASNITISGSEFNGNTNHGWYGDANSVTEPVLDNVSVSNTTFNDNVNKGIYLERLSNAVFDNITVNNSGTGGALNHRAGIDINLKWRTDYANISIINSTIQGCGKGDNNGAGILIKARSDGGTYGANPAALNNVQLTNLDIINCGGGTYASGIRIGEANNALMGTNTSPTNVVITGCNFISNSVFSLSNVLPAVMINAEMNWWDTIVETEIAAQVNGLVDYDPWIGHVAPSAPDNLSGTADTLFAVLDWNDNSFNESGFKIQRKDGDSLSAAPWVLIDSVGPNINTYTNTGLSQSTRYTYRVFSFNTMGNSHYSNLCQVTTLPLPPATFQLTCLIHDGWNIVSIPGLHPVNQNVDSWWINRDPVAGVFKYNNAYQSVAAAVPGTGYWMKHTGAQIYNTGDEWPAGGILYVPYDPINVNSGWNLIGGYDYLAIVSGITTNPPGIIAGQFFEYTASAGYLPADYLIPGEGYWVNISAAGQIMLPPAEYSGAPHKKESIPAEWGKVIITDNSGRSSALYAAEGEVDIMKFMLPPVPPAGSFDARFSSGSLAENVKQSKVAELNGMIYPVTVKVENIDLRMQDETGMIISGNVKSGEELIIDNPLVTKLIISTQLIPEAFSLEQNYPNPFNPLTNITFSLPEASDVSLSVYNIVGQKVAQVVNGRFVAGKHSCQWSAEGFASGMYIYEINAVYSTGRFNSTKKMLVVK